MRFLQISLPLPATISMAEKMTGGSFEWVTSKPDVVSLEKRNTQGTEKKDSTEIYARSATSRVTTLR